LGKNCREMKKKGKATGDQELKMGVGMMQFCLKKYKKKPLRLTAGRAKKSKPHNSIQGSPRSLLTRTALS